MKGTTVSDQPGLLALASQELGTSDWMVVDQDRVNAFGDAVGDHQWIHVDSERARSGPFGGTIVHGHLTMCLAAGLAHEVINVTGTRMVIIYGYNRVRFPAPLRVGTKIRARVRCQSADLVADDTVQCVFQATVEAENLEKPVCVADRVIRFVF
jgi:acyl dehydratase